MKIDELNKTALRAALSKAADLGWCFEQAPRHRVDLAKIIMAYLDRLADEPEPADRGRDRIAVSRFHGGGGVSALLMDGEDPDWVDIESVIDWELGQAARYIVRANVPPPAELVPVEVDGSVEVVS